MRRELKPFQKITNSQRKTGREKERNKKTILVKHPDNNEQNGIRKFVPVNNYFICEQIKFSNKTA